MGRKSQKSKNKKKAKVPVKRSITSSHITIADKKERLLEILGSLSAKGREEDALELINSVCPPNQGTLSLARFRILLRFLPLQAAEELKSSKDEEKSRLDIAQAVAAVALSFSKDVIDAFQNADIPFFKELNSVYQAFTLLEQGNNEEALKVLKNIRMISPFRNIRLFIRGLAAMYTSRDEEACRAFASLNPEDIQWEVATVLRTVLDQDFKDPSIIGQLDIEKGKKILSLFGLSERVDIFCLKIVQSLLRRNKINRAIRLASQLAYGAPPEFVTTIKRGLASALFALDYEGPEIAERIYKAFPRDPEDIFDLRLTALLCECENDLPEAIDFLKQYISIEDTGVRKLDRQNNGMKAVSAVLQRIGEVFESIAYSVEQQKRIASDIWQQAYMTYQGAIEFDTNNIEAWLAQIRVAENLRDRRERIRTLERFISFFPERAEALKPAAQAAYERKAFDKGLRFAQKASELEPLNRSVRNIEAKLLLGKAIKYYHAKKFDGARQIYGQAKRIAPLCTTHQQYEIYAQQAAFELLLKNEKAYTSIEKEVQTYFLGKWHWVACIQLALDTIAVKAKSPAFRHKEWHSIKWPILHLPEEPPTSEEELEGILQIFGDFFDAKGFQPPEMLRTRNQALECGFNLLSKKENLLKALTKEGPTPLLLKIAEHGSKLYPDDSMLRIKRYQFALEHGCKPDYFRSALGELEKAKQEIGRGFDENLSPFGQSRALFLIERLMTSIKVLIAQNKKPKKPKKPKKLKSVTKILEQLSILNNQ